MPLGIFVPLALLLYLASLAVTWPTTIIELTTNLVLACTLVAQFRLLDDLADLTRDRQEHPTRVLSRAVTLGHFHAVVVALFVSNALLIELTKPTVVFVLFLLLTVLLQIWYWLPGRMLYRGILNYHIVLLKYPFFVYVLASNVRAAEVLILMGVMIFVYLSLCIYELVHDRRYYSRQTV